MENFKNCVKAFVKEEEGMGVVEIILIIVVLIGLVVIFKDKIGDLVDTIMDSISEGADDVMDN